MDLLQTVRKEGSRGGRDEFKWTDVASSSHRENYLGHSLMAPVGRWQKGKDLNWYAKTDSIKTSDDSGKTEAELAADARKEELRLVKEAEEDARRKALGLPPLDRANPNLQALGGMEKATDRRQIGPADQPKDEGKQRRRRRSRSRSKDRKHRRRDHERDRLRDNDDREGYREHRRRLPSRSPQSRDERKRYEGRRREDGQEREVRKRRGDEGYTTQREKPRSRSGSRHRDLEERRKERRRSRSRSPYRKRGRARRETSRSP